MGFKDKNILVTGGTGFIGRNFIEHAKNKYKVLSPTHRELDLLDSAKVDKFFIDNKVDVVLHCANIGGLRSNLGLERVVPNNLRIFLNILRNKKRFGKMIHLGSGAEYDKSHNISMVEEENFGKRIPEDDYGFYKYICSKLIEKEKNIYCLRLFGVFGKYENFNIKFISNMLIKYIMKKPLLMIQDTYFDYIDINDLLRIIDYFIIHKPKHQFYNVGLGKRIKLLSIAKKINSLADYSQNIIIQKKGLNKEYTCSNRRLMNEMRDFEFTSLITSLKNLYWYYKKNLSSMRIKDAEIDKFNKV